MPQIEPDKINDTLQAVEHGAKSFGITALLGLLMGAMWKFIRSYTTKADIKTKNNKAEVGIIDRLEDEIKILQEKSDRLEHKVDELKMGIMELQVENAKLRIENQASHKHVQTLTDMLNKVTFNKINEDRNDIG